MMTVHILGGSRSRMLLHAIAIHAATVHAPIVVGGPDPYEVPSFDIIEYDTWGYPPCGDRRK